MTAAFYRISARWIVGVVAFATITLTGCVTRITDFTVLSTKNIDLTNAQGFERSPQRVTGEDQTFIFLFIPFGAPNMKEAADRALESVPGAIALVDGVVMIRQAWLVVGESTYIVEGTPLIDPTLISRFPPSSP